MPEFVELKLSNFRFAIGGEHYYGQFYVHGSAKHEYQWHDVCRILDDPDEVEYLKKKDHGGYLELGDETIRFNSEADVIKRATEEFVELFSSDDVLYVMEPDIHEDDHGEYEVDWEVILVGPEPFTTRFMEIKDHKTRRKLRDEFGYK